jgi:hypothetical protein
MGFPDAPTLLERTANIPSAEAKEHRYAIHEGPAIAA